ncbi:hypothetical protein O6H91_17G079500 [Diphasiastrum complanatum]|uniref:Uncharacterized protein n=1 Tax=Diphasiastrum complanatum TaxID=34168 RepID=A0ACC2B8J2_DIPCM|nr:hypothetical protein O6H91_17G079500 [Diphasiastrum complanatum]
MPPCHESLRASMKEVYMFQGTKSSNQINLLSLEHSWIIRNSQALRSGYPKYYLFVDNFHSLYQISYILRYSLKQLWLKNSKSLTKVLKKFG